ncbi:MAG: phosphatidate cytidylyltransferase, partial [Acidocella sp.]|nr:phosphatidate cytidylyltransferase [Acidocella sp.]
SGRWSDFGLRLASAAVLGPVALYCVWYGGEAWRVFLLVAAAGLASEWSRLAHLSRQDPGQHLILMGLIVGVAACQPHFAIGFIVLGLTFAVVLYFYGWFAAFGIPYAGVGAIALLWIRLRPQYGFDDTMFLITVVWGTDIGAYLTGRLLRGPKLAPLISPGKTWSGAVGGLLIGGFAAAMLAGGANGIAWRALPAAFLLSIFAQAGDLLESAIKRKLGVKDSGRTIPGHGGLFDRLDGFLAASPIAALLVLSVHGGLPLWG